MMEGKTKDSQITTVTPSEAFKEREVAPHIHANIKQARNTLEYENAMVLQLN